MRITALFPTLILCVGGTLCVNSPAAVALEVSPLALDSLRVENEQLRNALASSEKALIDLRQNLSAVSGEAEVFKRQVTELRLRMEALGVESGSHSGSVEQRLLTAVSDLRAATADKKQIIEALIRLTEAASLFAKTAGASNPDGRLALETELRNANQIVNGSDTTMTANSAKSLNDGVAISVKDDLSLVVMNLGSKRGVKVGMPFEVSRGEKHIGNVRVVDARESIAGATIQNLSSEQDRIRVGDRLKVVTGQ